MNTVEFIRQQFAKLHDQIDIVMDETTDRQFNWNPPGTANPIGVIYLHIINAEDFHVHAILQGKPRIWEIAGWDQKTGLASPPGRGRNWEETKTRRFTLDDLSDYQQAVRRDTDEYLAELSVGKLNETVSFSGGERQVAEVIAGLMVHMAGHAGEIAALKGIQGGKGLPF